MLGEKNGEIQLNTFWGKSFPFPFVWQESEKEGWIDQLMNYEQEGKCAGLRDSDKEMEKKNPKMTEGEWMGREIERVGEKRQQIDKNRWEHGGELW